MNLGKIILLFCFFQQELQTDAFVVKYNTETNIYVYIYI